VAKSRLILIGIANSIDLTIRTLTALETLDCKPALMTFSSYSHVQLHALLTDRLRQLPGEVFHPLAVRLCAKKVFLISLPHYLLLSYITVLSVSLCHQNIGLEELRSKTSSSTTDPATLVTDLLQNMSN
jgi:hypothetical protein